MQIIYNMNDVSFTTNYYDIVNKLYYNFIKSLSEAIEYIRSLRQGYIFSFDGTRQKSIGPHPKQKIPPCLLSLICRRAEVSQDSQSHKRAVQAVLD